MDNMDMDRTRLADGILRDTELDPGSGFVLFTLVRHMDGRGRTSLSIRELAEDSRQSEASVKRKIRVLAGLGYIEKKACYIPAKNNGHKRGKQTKNIYTVHPQRICRETARD